MTDRTLADEIADVFREEAAPEIIAAFHADTCQIMRGTVRVPDGYGGWTEEPAAHGEPFRCRLDADQRVGGENISGAMVLHVSSYTVEMPYDADVRATDTLVINGRQFDVTDPKRGGKQDMFLTVGVEERG